MVMILEIQTEQTGRFMGRDGVSNSDMYQGTDLAGWPLNLLEAVSTHSPNHHITGVLSTNVKITQGYSKPFAVVRVILPLCCRYNSAL